jgi:hypothetical protein
VAGGRSAVAVRRWLEAVRRWPFAGGWRPFAGGWRPLADREPGVRGRSRAALRRPRMPVARGSDDSCERSSDLPPIGPSVRRFRPSFNQSVRRSPGRSAGPADCRNVRPPLHRSQAPKPQHLVVSRIMQPPYLDERRVWWTSPVNPWMGWGRSVEAVWITLRPTPARRAWLPMFRRAVPPTSMPRSNVRTIAGTAAWRRQAGGVCPRGARDGVGRRPRNQRMLPETPYGGSGPPPCGFVGPLRSLGPRRAAR